MGKIQVLDAQTINQIAAGEVIENPASVVKELVENAIDAGATEITVEIEGGGRQCIRVTDNGCGMAKEDALLAFERHATSKLTAIDDLNQMATMGFRGEAIPSIASIARVTLITAPEKGEGTVLIIEGGQVKSSEAAPRSKGTTLEVKDLFFNVPVRRRFQRSPQWDTQEALKALTKEALAHPQIRFQLTSHGETLLYAPEAPLNQRIADALGEHFLEDGLPIDVKEEERRLFGWISPPTHHRPNRTGQYLIVNGRPICSHPLSYAIKEGYSTSLPSNRFPLFVLHLTLPPNQIDVNVHPQKNEVRLTQEWPLRQWMAQAIQNALTPKQQPKPTFTYTPTYTPPPRIVQEEMHIPYQTILPTFRALKTVKGYIFVEGFLDAVPDTSLHLLNQTLAEKALLDHQLKDPEPFEREQLLIPITFTVTPQESLLIEEHHDTLHRLGLEIRLFGTNTFLVDAHSHHWEGKDVKGEILTLLETPKTAVKTFTNRQTPSPRRLTTTEAQALIDQLTRKEIPFEPPLLVSLTPEQCQKLSSTL